MRRAPTLRELGLNPRALGLNPRALGTNPNAKKVKKRRAKKVKRMHVRADGGIPRWLRFEVFKRDGFRCTYCGRAGADVVLHVDHVKARANGGLNDPENLTTACQDCNLGKSATPLHECRI